MYFIAFDQIDRTAIIVIERTETEFNEKNHWHEQSEKKWKKKMENYCLSVDEVLVSNKNIYYDHINDHNRPDASLEMVHVSYADGRLNMHASL